MRIDAHHDGVYDTTLGYIAEETGRVTVQPQLKERHPEMQLYRIAAVFSPTLPHVSGRPQPSHVLGFQDVHGPTLLTTMTRTTTTVTDQSINQSHLDLLGPRQIDRQTQVETQSQLLANIKVYS